MAERIHTRAIVRAPGINFRGGITTSGLGVPVYEKAVEQHHAYCEALRSCGLEVIQLEPDERYPDGCFVEDTAVITEKAAVITRPGALSRRGEEERIAEILSGFRKIHRITDPGTVDGGDILRAENHFYIGLSQRTSREGAAQLALLLSEEGYTSSTITVGEGLHLKSGLAYIGNGNYLAAPAFGRAIREGNIILLDPEESYSANVLFVNGYLLIASGYPVMKEKLMKRGYDIIGLDMSEFRKMDGGLTCLSLLL